MTIYTRSERTVEKYTVYQAVESARRRLGADFISKHGMCVDVLRGRRDDVKITLEELNKISDGIYLDSLYYAGQL